MVPWGGGGGCCNKGIENIPLGFFTRHVKKLLKLIVTVECICRPFIIICGLISTYLVKLVFAEKLTKN